MQISRYDFIHFFHVVLNKEGQVLYDFAILSNPVIFHILNKTSVFHHRQSVALIYIISSVLCYKVEFYFIILIAMKYCLF